MAALDSMLDRDDTQLGWIFEGFEYQSVICQKFKPPETEA